MTDIDEEQPSYPRLDQILTIVSQTKFRLMDEHERQAWLDCESEHPLIGEFDNGWPLTVLIDGNSVNLLRPDDFFGGCAYNLTIGRGFERLATVDWLSPRPEKPEKILWLITQDHQEPRDKTKSQMQGMSDVGSGNWPENLESRKERKDYLNTASYPEVTRALPIHFKIFDDDGELYYSGHANTFDLPEKEAFAPLEWARIHAGCTRLEYYDEKARKWNSL